MRPLPGMVVVGILSACGGPGALAPKRSAVDGATRLRDKPLVPEWEAVPFEPPPSSAATLALDKEKLVRAELAARWSQLGEAAQQQVVDHGVTVVPRTDREPSIGAAYVELASHHVPFVVTLDALFALTFRAIDRALDELDKDELVPLVTQALTLTSKHLAAETRAERSDTAEPYAIARSTVLVALALMDPQADVPPDVKPRVSAELKLVQAHAGFSKSPLLGRVIDYGAFDLQGGLAFGDARIGTFRAIAWLARAAFALASEPPAIDVAMARTHTRTAMLLSRATNDAWSRAQDILAFVAGAGDDPGARRLLATARGLGVDLRDEGNLANVVRVDQVRTTLARGATPTIEDTGLRKPTFRLLSPSAPPDVWALHGAAARSPASSLAVGVALGSSEARTRLEQDAFPAQMLGEIARLLPTDAAERHKSIHASALDALAAYVTPSALDPGRPWRDDELHRRRKLEVALGAWSTLRHDELPLGHGSARAVLDEPLVAYEGVPAAVEPHPEAITRLLALVRQARRGLGARGTLLEGSAAAQLLDHVDALLVVVLDALAAQSRGAQSSALATVPSRIEAIERRMGPGASPLVVVTAADAASGHLLEDATGTLNDVWLAVETGTVVSTYVGVQIPFYESTATLRATDASWSKQLAESPPARPVWAL